MVSYLKKKKKIPSKKKKREREIYYNIYDSWWWELIARASFLENILCDFGGGSTVWHAKQQSKQSARLCLVSSPYNQCELVEQLTAPASLSNGRFLAPSGLSGTCSSNATEVVKATN